MRLFPVPRESQRDIVGEASVPDAAKIDPELRLWIGHGNRLRVEVVPQIRLR
jgi:hypothetical protein